MCIRPTLWVASVYECETHQHVCTWVLSLSTLAQVRVAAALSRIAAQEEQSFDGGEERVCNWDKARREKERKEEGETSLLPCKTFSGTLLQPTQGKPYS